MQHVFYSNGNTEKISWAIKTNKSTVKQIRTHADIYYDKVTNLQSKYIALHVGLFWGIGTFIIKNEDSITIKIDNKIMYEHLKLNKKINDEFIEKRAHFIKQLILQRKLQINFELISDKENIIEKII
ncbi:hypothetical protein NsoK4_02265 [Nitrosopumilus sp. K4]|uniref:hypothetical protein n=1 Tax=Nitrosopumilus sp. K4 TaxID=2795383 RepID=UPI001BA451DA|nr:hypothetical protein [Nitrosopumilus sp. K4]QUC65111.1 hypothetical protein NsoK4_02265 [Nitrosopumilus sp. K4]